MKAPTGYDEPPSRSLADVALVVIREAILQCELAPGQHVTEAGLSAQFGFGRAAIREALLRLRHDRLVTAIPRHGYAIAPITFKDVHDLFGLRLIIEPAAARLAAGRLDAAKVRELERLNEACRHARNEDAVSLRRANQTFHVAMAAAADNERLRETTQTVLDELNRVLYLPQFSQVWERIDASYDEHQRIVSRIEAGDGDGAAQASYEHILPNKQFVIDVLTTSPGLRSLNLLGI